MLAVLADLFAAHLADFGIELWALFFGNRIAAFLADLSHVLAVSAYRLAAFAAGLGVALRISVPAAAVVPAIAAGAAAVFVASPVRGLTSLGGDLFLLLFVH